MESRRACDGDLAINDAAGLFDSWCSVMMEEGLWIWGVYMMMVTIAMTDRAQPGKDNCGIIILLVNELRCVFGRGFKFGRD